MKGGGVGGWGAIAPGQVELHDHTGDSNVVAPLQETARIAHSGREKWHILFCFSSTNRLLNSYNAVEAQQLPQWQLHHVWIYTDQSGLRCCPSLRGGKVADYAL